MKAFLDKHSSAVVVVAAILAMSFVFHGYRDCKTKSREDVRSGSPAVKCSRAVMRQCWDAGLSSGPPGAACVDYWLPRTCKGINGDTE